MSSLNPSGDANGEELGGSKIRDAGVMSKWYGSAGKFDLTLINVDMGSKTPENGHDGNPSEWLFFGITAQRISLWHKEINLISVFPTLLVESLAALVNFKMVMAVSVIAEAVKATIATVMVTTVK